jgi:hypothetical protein
MPTLLLTLLTNRLAQIGMALIAGWIWGWASTSHSWREYVAQEKAKAVYALQLEMQRQAEASKEIAAEATQRLSDEQAVVAEMQRQIAGLKNAQADCTLTDDDRKRLRDFDAIRAPKPSRRAK